jgi:hypothetical protein
MTIGKIGVLVLAIALLSFGVGSAFADWRQADVGAAIQLADVDARKTEGGQDDVVQVGDEDEGDGDKTRGNDGTSGGNNTGDGDRTRGNDGTGGGDNTRSPAPVGGGDTGGDTSGGGTGGGDT